MKIYYRKTNELLAEGKRGWAITPFEGNFYISGKSLKTKGFRTNFIPGLCIYKFLYVGLDFQPSSGDVIKNMGWRYWLPNPLLPFIWFRAAVPQHHPELLIEDD